VASMLQSSTEPASESEIRRTGTQPEGAVS
jgi:hypothetical protein